MNHLSKLIFSGLMAIIPLSMTIYVLYWLGTSVESLSARALKLLLPEQYYYPGVGLVAGIIFLLIVGLLLRAWLFQRLFRWGEEMLAKVPMVKTVYSSLKDLTGFLSKPKGQEMGQVVRVELGDNVSIIAFLTCDNLPAVNKDLPSDSVAVYMPMSYQIGGHLLFVPRDKVHPVNMPMNEAMRFAITGGMTSKPKPETK